MFEAAASKIADAQNLLNALRQSDDGQTFRSDFNSFLNALRAVPNAVKGEGEQRFPPNGDDRARAFNEWRAAKWTEITNDDLLRFIDSARAEDFHEGRHALAFSSHISQMVVSTPPGASFVMNADGAYWLVGEGTPDEHLVPVRSPALTTVASVRNAPRSHLGQPLSKTDPITLCETALTYYRSYVHEARTRFGS